MSDFFRDFFRFIGRYRRGLFITFLSAVLFWCLLLFVSYRLSTDSAFCDSCHYEEPYVRSWQESNHADVDCIQCHIPSGLGGKIDRGYRSLVATLRYWGGVHNKIPRAEVDDRNCLQDGCHESRLITGPVEWIRDINFDHAHHIGPGVRGMDLRCTSCHSQIVQGAHMEVTQETCFLCHFKNLPRGVAVSGCRCHAPPTQTLLHEGLEFRHDQYLTLGVVCEECHVNVTDGTGEVSKARCVSCHNPRLEAFDNVPFMHRKHVTEHSVDCAACHEPIQHRDVELVRSLETTCTACHGKSHNPQRDVLMGIGAQGVDPYPSIMFKAQVGCDACHSGDSPGLAPGERIATATGEACVRCHGRGFDKMLEDWREAVQGYLDGITPLMDRARSAFERADPERRTGVTENYDRARLNLDFIREARGEHNLVYTKLVLLKVQEDLNTVLGRLKPSWKAEAPLAFTEDDLRGNCTKSCHANLRKTKHVLFQGLELTHHDHVYKHNLQCTYCHDNTEVHGTVKLQRENCIGCHHTQENVACADCHRIQQRMIAGSGGFGVEETPAWMADLACDDCHVDLHGRNNAEATREACVDCHEEGYDAMVAEWQADTRDRVAALRESLEDYQRLAVTARSRDVASTVLREAEKLKTQALAHIDLVENDRSMGVHNVEFVEALLDSAGSRLERARDLLDRASP